MEVYSEPDEARVQVEDTWAESTHDGRTVRLCPTKKISICGS